MTMQNNINDLLDDIVYMLGNLDEDGFSNEKIKQAIKDNIKEIKFFLEQRGDNI
jgi:hypothetical protein